MKKLIYGVLLATMSVSALATTASAWGYTRCRLAAGTTAGTVTNIDIAENCRGFMVGEGVISRGINAGKQWKEAYPDVKFESAADTTKVKMVTEASWGKIKFHYTVNDRPVMRTKEIDSRDIHDYLKKIGVKKVQERAQTIGEIISNSEYTLHNLQ